MNATLNTCVVAFFIVGLIMSKYGGIDKVLKRIFHKEDKDEEEK